MTDLRGQAFTGEFDAATARILPSALVTSVTLVRHGDVADMSARVVRGQLDVPVSERGVEQGRALVDWLARSEAPPDVLFTSDLLRCRVLAAELARAWGIEARPDARLREQSMGTWEGRTWPEITAQDGRAVTAYWDDYHATRPTGGESFADLEARVARWWAEIEPSVRGQRVTIVTHVGVIRALVCAWLGVPGSQALRFAPATASITSFQLGEAGAVLGVFGERPWLAGAAGAPGPVSFSGAGGEADAHAPSFHPGPIGAHPSTAVSIDAPARRSSARPAALTRTARRIALSGSAGTGKTTLGRRLASDLGLPFIEEGMRERLEKGFDLHGMRPADWQRLVAELWSEQRAREDAAHDGFVADRSSLDYAAFWLHYGLHEGVGPTESFLAARFEDARRYDRILLFPWGALPLVHDGVRSTNRWTQLRYQALLEGLIERFAPANVVRIPGTADFEQRRREAFAALHLEPAP